MQCIVRLRLYHGGRRPRAGSWRQRANKEGSRISFKDVDEVATILEIQKEENKCQLLKIIRDN